MLRTEAVEPVDSPGGSSACGDEEQAVVSRAMPIVPINLEFMRRLRIAVIVTSRVVLVWPT